MARFNIYRLFFDSPLHIGNRRDDYGISLQTVQSDTLYAAIISSLAKTGKAIPDDGDLGCTVSSLFPFSGDCLFLPKPMTYTIPDGIAPQEIKKYKKIQWLGKNLFEKSLKGENIFTGATKVSGKFAFTQDIPENFIRSSVSPRAAVSRKPGEDTNPFYMDRIFFAKGSGLYFISSGDTALLEEGMKLLQHEGIGTDRNVGNGQFHYETDQIEIQMPASADNAISLSIFIPENEEQLKDMLEGNIAYELTRRGGWITTAPYNTIRKNSIHAFMPGSVFHKHSESIAIYGKNADLTPYVSPIHIPYKIWRNGKSIFLPIIPQQSNGI